MKIKLFLLLSILQLGTIYKVVGQIENDTLMVKFYNEAKAKIDKKNFLEANDIFKKILDLKATVPDELAYFYGYTLINLNKYTLGKQFLKKYIELTTDTGRYSHYANDLMNIADCKEVGSYFVDEKCNECEGEGRLMIKCHVCNGRGNELCTLCGGVGVLKKRDNFGETFSNCQKCDGTGDYECTLCQGSREEKGKCYVCDGRGKVKIKKECDAMLMGQGKQ